MPHLSSTTKIRILSGIAMEARIMMFVVPGEQPNSTKTAETLAAITGGRVTVLETRPYIQRNDTGSTGILPGGGKKLVTYRYSVHDHYDLIIRWKTFFNYEPVDGH